ncbi:hypothetical protein V1520DRAFT_64633 [Lipomyces starkeyi]|uniref:Uncharacterized protein n=1 Tax=Lipomyces starkeyi NRRL Y-11557 TaxID=675824 RepID=A0A1E3QG21_LIPST|nr:hypothetical protein LIPSTDRAFT_139744 [Lipomyces starkeyi NRRL Y-11557]
MSVSDTTTILHLQTSAHSIIRQSPAIASHLYGSFREIANTKFMSLPSQLARSACAACNTVWIPGYNLQVLLHTSHSKKTASLAKRKDKRQRQTDKIVKEHIEQDNRNADLKKFANNGVLPKKETVIDCKNQIYHKKVLCYFCLTCGHMTRFSIPGINAVSQNKNIVPTAIETPTSTPQRAGGNFGINIPAQDSPSSTKLSTSASSRKRQKMRKQNSLQQMLAKAKAEKSEKIPSGMKLMDIMKSANK